VNVESAGDITPITMIRVSTQPITISGVVSVRGRLSSGLTVKPEGLNCEGDILKSDLTAKYRLVETVSPSANLNPIILEKIRGDFGDFECIQKLYPVKDANTDLTLGRFVGPYNESGNLYSFIDDGVFIGDHDKQFGQSQLLSDDNTSFIQPSTFNTEGEFQYKAEVTNVLVRPDVTRFRMRASAPIRNYEAKVPPKYTVHNIKLTDPSGNLVVHYNDLIFKGDTDQDNKPNVNFATLSSSPRVNNVAENYEWQNEYPFMHQVTGYQISFDVKVEALDDAFAPGFDGGFEEDHILFNSSASGSDYLALDGSPLSTQDQSLINPTKNIRISAIEICNSGGYGPRYENYLKLYTEVPVKGRRIEKKIIPSFMPLSKFDTGIWPSVSSVWHPNDLLTSSNQDECGAEHIVKNLSDGLDTTYATISTIGPHLDSGKLTVKFSHSSETLDEITDGAFNFAFDQSIANSWYHPSGAFNTEDKTPLHGDKNGFFKVESVTLKVRAKKAIGSRNFVLDVVGYSDDKLLNITKAPSGFLQNPSEAQVNNIVFTSEGIHPYVSGFRVNSNDLSIAGESLSEKDTHFEASGNLGGDHYSLATYPKVTSTDFADYEVPLKIYDDKVKIGTSRDYSMSSLFENLYLDIYPIPVGASIADIHLLVRFAPQDAFNLSIEGGEQIRKISDGRSEGKIFPTARSSSNDAILNAGSGYNPISTITNIPHAYTTPSSIKTNYSRRWRGQTGTAGGPFDVDMFSFGFANHHVKYPFLKGHYTFDKESGGFFVSEELGLGASELEINMTNGSLLGDVRKNIGWRFSSGTLFQNHLPGYTTSYETADWTSYSDGTHDFTNDDLYGKIADAFDTTVRVSGQGGGNYIDIQPANTVIDTVSGFSVFLRFIPDQNVSGANHNLFNSGVLFSKWESPASLDFSLGYKDGYLTAYAKDINQNLIEIKDTLKYHAYSYPLSVLLTYNDHNQSGLKLYTDNEASGVNHTYLRASSAQFHKASYSSEDAAGMAIGWSAGSGVGMNMLVSEFGMSTFESGVNSGADVVYPYGSGTNIVESNPDRTHQQVTAEEFLNGHRSKFYEPGEGYSSDTHEDTYKLWDYVNEDISVDWNLGGFKYKHFNSDFASLASSVGKRTGRDLIGFNLKHHGSGYIQYANFAMPENVDSGVAYHTQIENDFLRFHLSDTPSNFYSAHRRITKNLPAGYKFTENALVVDTIIEHETDSVISWEKCLSTVKVTCSEHRHYYEGLFGPKLIVSLYTKRQEPRWNTDEPNWGLINRDVHYLSTSSSITQLSSTFSYDNLTDETEQWALFPNEPRYKDFSERYFSQDVDDMFLQYDIVYPSGPAFESDIKIHSAHVRMENAYVNSIQTTGNMNIFASGGNVLNENLSTYISGSWFPANHFPPSGLNLNISGPTFLDSNASGSGLPLSLFGKNLNTESIPLYTIAVATLDSDASGSGLPLLVEGEWVESGINSINLVLPLVKDSRSVNMPLHMLNSDVSFRPPGGFLDLFTYAVSGDALGIRSIPIPLNISGKGLKDVTSPSESLNLNIFGFDVPENRFPSASMPLFIDAPLNVSSSMPLYITNIIKAITSVSNSKDGGSTGLDGMNLFAANYGGIGSDYLMWYNNSYGKKIDLVDNVYTSVSIDNEIRGVDLIGYGSCTGDSPRKAIERALITDDTVWRPEKCEEGGIFRATNTYDNPTASGFGSTVGYSGNYYGIRKYTGLKSGGAYNATLNVVTGNTKPINVPRDLEDWEYGHCGPEHFVDAGGTSGCCASDCEQSIVYSGGKLIGDYPIVDNNLSLTPASGRNTKDNYGRTVSVVGDLMAVGSPNIQIPYIDVVTETEQQIDEAGAIFLYRRGTDVAGRKASWGMEDKIMLPSGYRKDFITNSPRNLVEYDQWSISGKQWNIGQEGRRLGTSLDLCSSGDRETIVAGAPFAKWTRQFDNIVTSGIRVGLVIFTDSFTYDESMVSDIQRVARKWDILYKYFSAPWNAGTAYEFQPQLEIQLLVFELARSSQDQKPIGHDNDWFHHKYIQRMDDPTEIKANGHQATYDSMFSGIKDEFLKAFDYYKGPHSGIPPVLGVFREKSHSAGLGAFYNPLDGKNVVSEFINFYEEYAITSGVTDPKTSTPENGYYNLTLGQSEDWAKTAKDLMNDTLNSGNLIKHDALRYITSGVGQEWAQENAYQFQIPPSSGGRVYVFEKESGIFNCVQEIKSKGDDDWWNGGSKKYNNRYGHSVSISKNSEVISIGSPFTRTPCQIYERDESANKTMYAGIRAYLDLIDDTSAVQRYDILLADSGSDIAQRVGYHEMTQDHKLAIRIKNNITLYKPVFEYKYSDIGYIGTWGFLVSQFLGTSRLGYSTSVSDDGDTVAFGAPTDSMTLFEDNNVWYRGKDTWASYTNAGAVRIFESKKIYPHSGVVEYTRFGNLDRSMHETERDQGFYDQMGLYFQPSDLPFRRTDFEELDIPVDAGLAFIITPELDADSDEILDNIKKWLALGDRTLVLVGNDPIYEENGLYKESNDVVNRLLKKLGSRMTIVPADTKSESLPDCVSDEEVFNDRYNVIAASKPRYGHVSNLSTGSIFAKGVGDIRIDVSDLDLQDTMRFAPCRGTDSACQLPIKHLGDLRASWWSKCTAGSNLVHYRTNWPFHFGNPNPSQGCDYPPEPLIGRPYEDIVPVLAAAEYTPDSFVIVPDRSGVKCVKTPCYEKVPYERNVIRKTFAEVQEDTVAFSILEGSNSELSGIFEGHDSRTFFDPDKKNSRDCILQAEGFPFDMDPVDTPRTLYPDSILALQEAHYSRDKDNTLVKTSSNVIIMASMLGETTRSFGFTGDDGSPSNNQDQNVLFYVNMLMDNCKDVGKVLQLGGWTMRESFKAAYTTSLSHEKTNMLKEALEQYNIEVEENFVLTDELEPFPDKDKVTSTEITTLWIANPLGKPSDAEVNRINSFLERGNKKLVITYAGNNENSKQIIAENVAYICSALNLGSRPFFVPSIGEYFTRGGGGLGRGNRQDFPYETKPIQRLNPETIPTTGCRYGYEFFPPHVAEPVDTKVEKLALWSEGGDPEVYIASNYIPISGGGDFKRIISYDVPIKDITTTIPEIYRIDSDSTITFSTQPGSGYRIYWNWVSETENEHYPVNGSLVSVSNNPNTPETVWEFKMPMPKTTARSVNANSKDFVSIGDSITLNLAAKHQPIYPDKEQKEGRGLPPLTPRVLSISGCLLPILTSTSKQKGFDLVPCKPKPYTEVCTPWFVSGQKVLVPGVFREISHPSQPYCDPTAPPCPDTKLDKNGIIKKECCSGGEKEVEDGPVIVAEEFEHFTAGINGNKRSKIVVISDSTLLQGQCPQYRSDSLYENQEFIRSLYPDSPDKSFGSQAHGGRNFQFTQKIRGPERGSAAKYYAVSGIPNTTAPLYHRQGVKGHLDYYVDNEDTYNPDDPGFIREPDPETKKLKEAAIKTFGNDVTLKYGVFPRFSGDFLNLGAYNIEGNNQGWITDADSLGGLPDLMKLNGTDYLDFDIYNSGCPGDLFGFSIDLTSDKLVVGTPFNAFRSQYAASGVSGIVQWHEIENDPTLSGIDLSENGGGGAAFYFERTGSGSNAINEFLPWEFRQKIKPISVNAGLPVANIVSLTHQGDHNLDAGFILDHGRKPDQFGHSVAMDADMIAVGAPNHNFESLHDHSIYSSGEFIRKEFNRAFVIPHHVTHDLGASGIRGDIFANTSGTLVLNNGAVYSFKHDVIDWTTRAKEWAFKEKLYAQGHKDRTAANKYVTSLVSGCENDHFGWSVGLNRAKRGDSDYTLIAGAPFHDFATSGNHPQSASDATPVNGLREAGSAYTFDGMLRGQVPSIPNSGGWIEVEVFGDKSNGPDQTRARVYQPRTGDPLRITVSGLVFANENGDIFLECSGFDPSSKGFIAHRPYVESVAATMIDGTGIQDTFSMNIFGKPNSIDNSWPSLVGNEEFDVSFSHDMDSLVYRPSGMSLFITGPDSANVYNSMNINVEGIKGLGSGTMFLIASASGTDASGSLNLNIGSEFPSNILNLNVRGR